MIRLLAVIVISMIALSGCGATGAVSGTEKTSALTQASAPITPPAAPTQSFAQIDWVDFIRFNGITYTSNFVNMDQAKPQEILDKEYGTISFKLADNVHEPNYQSKDGDASYLEVGTPVYAVKGYDPTCLLVAWRNGKLVGFRADNNPKAVAGRDLLDIEGKVAYIGINSEQDGTTELAEVGEPKQVNDLVKMVLEAPVNQAVQGQTGKRYFIEFHLKDGISLTSAYWPDSGQLVRGVQLPKGFADAVKQAVTK